MGHISKSVKDYVRMYAGMGYATFATSVESKAPLLFNVDWRKSEIDKDPLDETYPQGQFGVVLRDADLVIDLDPRNMNGEKVWAKFKAQFNIPESIEDTMCVLTGGGGVHIYLKKPPCLRIRKNLKGFPGIDFLTKGAYVIGGGSWHASGKQYKFHNKPVPNTHTPESLLMAITKTESVTAVEKYHGFRDDTDNQERFKEYLNTVAVPAIEGQNGDVQTFKTACRGREFNLSPEVCYVLMAEHYNPKCSPAWSAEALRTKVRNAYAYNDAPAGTRDPVVVLPDLDPVEYTEMDWTQKLTQSSKGVNKPTLTNAELILLNHPELKGLFVVNEFTDRIEVRREAPWEGDRTNILRQMNDREFNYLSLWLARRYGLEYPGNKLWQVIDVIASRQSYHPIKTWLDELQWDGIPRLDSWLTDYAGVMATRYSQAVGRKTLVGAVARIYDPGCKFDHVLILEGEQGIGKSTCCSILGGPWYGDAPLDLQDKDTVEYVHTHWIIELSELISVRKADVNRLKNFISRQEDNIRKPYMRARDTYPRQCIFIGTINPEETGYLVDTTGNRRYWPVLCRKFDLKGLRHVREQLFAEAKEAYFKKETVHLDEEEYKLSQAETDQRVIEDPWVEIFTQWNENNPMIKRVTTAELYQNVLGGSFLNMTTGHQKRISRILQMLGWVKKREANGMGYRRPEQIQGVK